MTILKNLLPTSGATVEVWANALSWAAAVILAAQERTTFCLTHALFDAPLRSPVHQ